MKLHPQIIKKGDKDEFVVLPIEEFEALVEKAETYEDLVDLRTAKTQSRQEQGRPLDDVIAELAPELKR